MVTISFVLPLVTTPWFTNEVATWGYGLNNMGLPKFHLAIPLSMPRSAIGRVQS